MRTLIDKEPFSGPVLNWSEKGFWQAKWISHPRVGLRSEVVAYRLRFSFRKATRIRVHVSADERYELFLDGARVGRGPERGDRENWFYETYDFKLSSGKHVFVVRTWWLGPACPSPYAQMSVRPGFILAAEGKHANLLNTGIAPWECKRLTGYKWVPQKIVWGTGAKVHISGADFPWGLEKGIGDGWRDTKAICAGRNASVANEWLFFWMLRPAMLPPMMESYLKVGKVRHIQSVNREDSRALPVKKGNHLSAEENMWNQLLRGTSSITIPVNTMRRVIVDLGNYFCAYPEIILSGGKGAKVRILWAESLYEDYLPEKLVEGKIPKGNRNDIEGKFFIGVGDTFEPDGGVNRRFDTLWWEAGRYLEIFVSTSNKPLTIKSIGIRETHYPYKFESRFKCSDSRLNDIVPIALQTLKMCSHETYMDCPYYEQLMYVGDTRLEALVSYCMTHDGSLAQKALLMFDKSRRTSGITQSRYPSRVMQIIPTFSLWWVAMVHDYVMWRNNLDFVASLMPGVRAVLEAYRNWVNSDGLVESPNGWNFMDWVPGWFWGIPPDADTGINATINWQTVLVLQQAAQLEELAGESELASRNRKLAERIAESLANAFWDEQRGIFAEDMSKKHFSEHTQCMAILSGKVNGTRRKRIIQGLLRDPNLYRTTIYFTHYLFETYRLIGRMDKFFERMSLWFGLKEQGFKTTPECPEPSRSDCHAWSTHPVFHYFASVLGIRPAKPGFANVQIEPQLGPLTWAKGSMPHPRGFISVDFEVKDGSLSGTVELPERTYGMLTYKGKTVNLRSGRQHLCNLK